MPLTPLLFLCPRVPQPLNTGAKIRTNALLTALKTRFGVHYAGFLDPELDRRTAMEYLDGCASVQLFPEPARSLAGKAWLALRTLPGPRPVTIAKYWNLHLAACVRQWLRQNPGGAIHADHLHMAPYLEPGDGGLRVLDEHNVESRIVERMADQCAGRLHAPYLRLQARRMRAFEARAAQRGGLVLAVSGDDAAELGRMAPRTRIEVVPNGVDLEYFAAPSDGRRPHPGRLVFIGSMGWLPNHDAMLYFAGEILPILYRRFGGPEAWSLDIVGHSPLAPVRTLASARVRVTGSVPDVRPYMREAMVYVVPLRVGGGSRLKILEAFAMGIPVVSTSVGCEGLDARHERHLLIADTPDAFAEAVARLAASPALRESLAAEALRHARTRFGWPAIGSKLTALYEEILATGIITAGRKPRVGRQQPGVGSRYE